MSFKKNNQAGFTLIEIIIVVVILAIISFISIPSYRQYSDKQKLSTVSDSVKDNIRSIQNKAFSGQLSSSSLTTKWYVLVQTDQGTTDHYEYGACTITDLTNCLNTASLNYTKITVPTGFYVKVVPDPPEPADRYNGIAQVGLVFNRIDGTMALYKTDGTCLGALTGGVCSSDTATIKVGSNDYTQKCYYHNLNHSGAIRTVEKACS